LEQLLSDKEVFEYWSHAAAYLPMRDFRFSLTRKRALANGDLDHWYERDEKLMKFVLKRLEAEGPLMAKDFEHHGKRSGEWKTKPAKRALEYLFMQGDLMIPRRVNFHKVYDLTERVLPPDIDTTPPTPKEYARFLITSFLRANGLGQPSEITYLLKGTKPLVVATLKEMASTGEVLQVRAAGHIYYALPENLAQLSRPLARNRLKILSPFDNLLIQRKRMKELFDFDYLIECYLPKAKRQYGYFSLPILWDGKLVARMDCRSDRKESRLHIHNLALEPDFIATEAFFLALQKELRSFLHFNHCDRLELHKTSPETILPKLRHALKEVS
jgi:uncharacterized protein YcaQ